MRGSGRKPILRFVPAAEILQSNQTVEHAYYDILTSGETVFARICQPLQRFRKCLESSQNLAEVGTAQTGLQ